MAVAMKQLAPKGPLFQLTLLVVTVLHLRVGEAVNSEGIALQDFRQRLADPAGALSNWNNSDITPCNWKGVFCHNLTNVVISIILPRKNLTGFVSPQLAELKHLERLILHNNNLSGRIPEALGNLTSLRVLHLLKNAVSGNIPSSLGMLKQLRILELSNNKLQGPIPASLSSLSRLKYFNVSNNLLSGKVPDEILQRFNGTSYVGNVNLCGGAQGLSPCAPSLSLRRLPDPPVHCDPTLLR